MRRNRRDMCTADTENKQQSGSPDEEMPVFQVVNFGVSFSQYERGINRKELHVITDLDIELYEGKILAVVGSSGSGKSLLAHAIMGILPGNASIYGKLYYHQEELTQAMIAKIRGRKICLIPQSVNYLDPLEKVGSQISRAVNGASKAEKKKRVIEMMEKYSLSPQVYDYYPHQLSGGMARKILLSIALLSECEILIADEPTPGLDEPSLEEVLQDFRLAADEGKAILMITHDIQAAVRIADRIAVFYAGSTLEVADAKAFSGDGSLLSHPYSKALLQAMPQQAFLPIEGVQPMPGNLPEGCLFYERCPVRCEDCMRSRPQPRPVRGGKVRCFYAA